MIKREPFVRPSSVAAAATTQRTSPPRSLVAKKNVCGTRVRRRALSAQCAPGRAPGTPQLLLSDECGTRGRERGEASKERERCKSQRLVFVPMERSKRSSSDSTMSPCRFASITAHEGSVPRPRQRSGTRTYFVVGGRSARSACLRGRARGVGASR